MCGDVADQRVMAERARARKNLSVVAGMSAVDTTRCGYVRGAIER